MNFSEIEMIARFPFRARKPMLIDVGAHHGFSSMPFASSGWRVIAFEPELANFAALEKNLGSNPNVQILPLAVSNSEADNVPFYVSKEHYGIHSLIPFHETHEESLNVRTVRLDDILEEIGITDITLLKIDVEGADFPALMGLSIENYRPELVMLEFMDSRTVPGFDYNHHDVVSYMAAKDYVAFISEWAPVTEYAREGEQLQPHKWLGWNAYPLAHTPAWGNLIFVPGDRVNDLQVTVTRYLREMSLSSFDWLRPITRRVPSLGKVYRFLRNK